MSDKPVLASTRGELQLALGGPRRVPEERREDRAARLEGRVALVPTMGALHTGHAALMQRARQEVGPDAPVVASIFVNPLQFAPGEDLDRYPRTLDADLEVCAEQGVDVVFAPAPDEVYPGGDPLVTIAPGPLALVLEGRSRPTHFAGVLTVVAKLLGLVRPDVAVFGEKDYQQLALVRRMVADLCMGVDVVGAETVREPDGLALSSRNRFLDAEQHGRALALSRALFAARDRAGLGGGGRPGRRPVRARCSHRGRARLPRAHRPRPRPRTGGRGGAPARRRPCRQHPADRQPRPRPGLRPTGLLEVPMLRTMMTSKIHRATVTQADLHYVGSVTVDEDLLDAADILPGELVHIVDVTNGARLETYTIAGQRGSGVLGINGAAARLVHTGDVVILIAYGQMETAEARELVPHVVFVDADNRVLDVGGDPAAVPSPVPEEPRNEASRRATGLLRGDVVA